MSSDSCKTCTHHFRQFHGLPCGVRIKIDGVSQICPCLGPDPESGREYLRRQRERMVAGGEPATGMGTSGDLMQSQSRG